ncbi:MAG: hydantoinase/oxoprolinase family protein [Chloroflexota bacterium]
MRIGIDVGGTNTDAVLMNGTHVLASHKTPTTSDVTSGITDALKTVMSQAAVPASDIQTVMIGTTHFTNAIVERRRLTEVAAIRLGLPATKALPPMIDWPDDLRMAIGAHRYLAHGGYEFNGQKISDIDQEELRNIGAEIHGKGIRSIAISSVYSPVNTDIEEEAAKILQETIPGVSVTLSHEIGRIGLLERENAAILNACLRELADQIVEAFGAALKDLQIDAPFYLSQNDGTLMNDEFARKYPVLTIASGPTNSMRGAAFLSGVKDGVVVDVGGTTSDVGMLLQGFPREASVAVEVGGVRTNFRMPDVYSFGLGGGSLVADNGTLLIGPQSVGYELTKKALVFGGDTLTTTDIIVAAGQADVGDGSKVDSLDASLVERSLERIQEMTEIAVDRMKTSADAVPVIVVGGGSILITREVSGASEMIKPDHFAVANAVGAAIAQVGGETDTIFSLDNISRDDALTQAKDEAVQKAVANGAAPESVEIVDIEEIPLAYLPGSATRMRVKAIGDLK